MDRAKRARPGGRSRMRPSSELLEQAFSQDTKELLGSAALVPLKVANDAHFAFGLPSTQAFVDKLRSVVLRPTHLGEN